MYFKTEDKTLSRDVGIVAGILFTSAVFENALLQITQFPFFENGKTNQKIYLPTLQIYSQIKTHLYNNTRSYE